MARKPPKKPTASSTPPDVSNVPSARDVYAAATAIARTGRPSLLTDEVVEKICKSLRVGAPLVASALYAGVGRSTLFLWIKTGRKDLDEERDTPAARFVTATEAAMAGCTVDSVELIAKAGADPRFWSARAWLEERRDPERFGRREPFGPRPKDDGTDQEAAFDYGKLSATERRLLRELLNKARRE